MVCLSEYDLETSIMKRPRPTRAVEPWGRGEGGRDDDGRWA
jgi:hypothetical protein